MASDCNMSYVSSWKYSIQNTITEEYLFFARLVSILLNYILHLSKYFG